MFDFAEISHTKTEKRTKTIIDIFPIFLVKSNSNDLMIRGRDFYAVWDEDQKIWSMDEQTVVDQIDRETEKVYQKYLNDPAYEHCEIRPKYMRIANSGLIDQWHKYVQKQCRDKFRQLDEKVLFSNSGYSKRDYSSKRMNYALEDGDISAYDELMSVLYDETERTKLEWAIGSVIAGDSKKIQKFIFLYGGHGTGKSTVLDIIEWLFDGYWCSFEAKDLGNSNSSFALESFKDNPLIGIDPEAKLDRIDDNTKLNSLVAHEHMEVNEKFKSKYTMKFNTFLFMASNNMVKITDARSGIIRRVIDVVPTGNLVDYERYFELREIIKNEELGAIAKHCLDRYNELGISYYSKYVPTRMIEGTNDFYNFMQDRYFEFRDSDELTLGYIWQEYKKYCEEANVPYPMTRQKVRIELMEYFDNYTNDVYRDGKHTRCVYSGLKTDKFEGIGKNKCVAIPNKSWLELGPADKQHKKIFSEACADCPAQEATEDDKPGKAWDNVKTVLRDISESRVHYVRVPAKHIVIDFDLKNEKGEKDLKLNMEAAKAFPPTYAEVSKGGQGLHLHYIYAGDPETLCRLFDENIEVKVFTGKSSLRRKLSLCNALPIAVMAVGFLPVKGKSNVINFNAVKSEKQLRTMIIKNLNKEYHDSTAPSVDFILKILDDAYDSGMHYDVSDLKPDVLAFATQSSHQSQKCIRQVGKMKFKSEEPAPPEEFTEDKIIFFDVEVFPNLFVVCFKGIGEEPVKMINPTPDMIEKLCRFKLVGFNNRRYDNHILYARMQGYSNEQLYRLSQKIIDGHSKSAFFGEAYNLSYTDIYDFAAKKQGLKKWEIELGIHHQELGLPWDQPVDESLWQTVADYCVNDVIATEAVFNKCHGDFEAREILVALANIFAPDTKSTVNDTTNSLTARIIFGNNKKPQNEFVYTDLATGKQYAGGEMVG